MENRIARYKSLERKKLEKILKMVLEGDKKEVSCLNKKYLDHKKHKDDITGYVHAKNKKYTGKEYATLYGIEDYKVDIYSKKKIYERVVAYIKIENHEYLAVTKKSLFLLILLGLLIIGLLMALWFIRKPEMTVVEPQEETVIVPSGEIVEDDEDGDIDTIVKVVIPDGDIIINGPPVTDDGKCYIMVTLTVNGKEHTLIQKQETTIKDGKFPDFTVDWNALDVELKPGVYDGTVYITEKDGTITKKPIQVFIVSSTSGTIDMTYSNEVKVNLPTSKISLSYMPSNASKASMVQVILTSGKNEYILAESVPISNNQKLTSLTLDETMKSRLQQGAYNGILRVYMDSENNDLKTSDIHTDIKVTISVYE